MHDTGMHNLLHLPSFKDDRQYPTPSFYQALIGKLDVWQSSNRLLTTALALFTCALCIFLQGGSWESVPVSMQFAPNH